EGEDFGVLDGGQYAEGHNVAGDDLSTAQGTRHQAVERALPELAEERHRGDDEHQEEHNEPDEGGPEVVERIEARTTIEKGDPGRELNRAGLAGEPDEGLTDRL